MDTRENYPIASYPFGQLAMAVVNLPACAICKGHKADTCLVVVCRAKGYSIAIPKTMQGLTRENVADLLLEKCVCFKGILHKIVPDNAKYFNNKFVHILCQLAGIDKHECFVYSQKTNGQAKRVVKTVVESLRLYLQDINTPPQTNGIGSCLWRSGASLTYPVPRPHIPPTGCFLGGTPLGSGTPPPMVSEDACEDALEFAISFKCFLR